MRHAVHTVHTRSRRVHAELHLTACLAVPDVDEGGDMSQHSHSAALRGLSSLALSGNPTIGSDYDTSSSSESGGLNNFSLKSLVRVASTPAPPS